MNTPHVDDLTRKLSKYCAPGHDRKALVEMSCTVEFEPHGRATETWELIWRLSLPHMPYYWKGTDGWRKGKEGKHPVFSGRTPQKCLEQATEFVSWYLEQPEAR